MGRPHCMFVQNQALPWRENVLGGWRASLSARLLSRDSESGALTAVVNYPPGADMHGTGPGRDEEWLLLTGDAAWNDQSFGAFSYAFLPAGVGVEGRAGPRGASALVMVNSDSSSGMEVVTLNPSADGLEGWTENPYTRYLMGTGVRPLRENPETKEASFLYAALPFRYMAKRWTHPVAQEMFVLSGDYAINDVGLMTPGAYAWWEPHRWHGPYGSRTGFIMLIRSHGGPLSNIIDDEIAAVDYQPDYRPVLPEGLDHDVEYRPKGQTLV